LTGDTPETAAITLADTDALEPSAWHAKSNCLLAEDALKEHAMPLRVRDDAEKPVVA
jgi:hypothetical protein